MDLNTLRKQFSPHRQRQKEPEYDVEDVTPEEEIDHEKQGQALKKILRDFGVTAQTASDGFKALAKAAVGTVGAAHAFNKSLSTVAKTAAEANRAHPNGIQSLNGMPMGDLEPEANKIRRAVLGEAQGPKRRWPKRTMAFVKSADHLSVEIGLLAPGLAGAQNVEGQCVVGYPVHDKTGEVGDQLLVEIPEYPHARGIKRKLKTL